MNAEQRSGSHPGDGRPQDLFESKLHPPLAPRRSSPGPRSSIGSMRRTCRSPSSPRRRATARRRCWPNGRSVTLRASRGSRSTGTTMISGGWCRTPRPRSIGSTRSAPRRCDPTAGRRSVATVASRVAAAMSGMKEPVVLVLDHVESLHERRMPRHDRRARAPPPGRLPACARDARRAAAAHGPPSRRRRRRRSRRRRPRDDGTRGARAARRRGRATHRRRAGPSARAHRGMAGRACTSRRSR